MSPAVRLRSWRCNPAPPPLPRRIRGANLPAAPSAPTRQLPTVRPGRVGGLPPALRRRTDGGHEIRPNRSVAPRERHRAVRLDAATGTHPVWAR
ncbi:hypothetical protein QTQ03_07610 [Micromonospora sp. WMMA1363]|uniref:hypothetical protein n=1 Tax=Micromonospora sp. WMMA1363 TaxID=3053985 RepID=UPI00259D0FAE|nr:hypothetical protein [Micromonospora sp. WMMA1363]MDM4719469.1 hypothetical protein [Micromonospora sp. WMMA1363]